MICYNCNSVDSFLQYEMAYNNDGVMSEVLVCKKCLVLCNPKLFSTKNDNGDIVLYQSGNVSSVYSNISHEEYDYKIHQSRKIFDFLSNHDLISSKGAFLDYGCGAGYLAIAASEIFDFVSVVDLDVSIIQETILRKNIQNITIFENINQSEIKYDLITLWHTLEHIVEPRSLLKNLKNMLADKGLLFIQTPLYRKEHFIDSHLWFFNAASVSYIARDLGFSSHTVSYDLDNSFITYSLKK